MSQMISAAMNKKLNAQITNELSASHVYLAMACALDEQGYRVVAQRFHSQSGEERGHAMKLIKYVTDVGGQVKLGPIADPKGDFSSPLAVFQAALAAEQQVTKDVAALVAHAEKENDYAARGFLQWYVDEQVEEVASMSDLVRVAERASDPFQIELYLRHTMQAQ